MNPAPDSIVGRGLPQAGRRRLALAGVVFLLASAPAVAKSYRVVDLMVDARFERDGTLRVEEAITCRLTGRYRFAYRDIPTSGEVSISNVGIREAGMVFAQSTGESPGTFKIAPLGGRTRVTWHDRAHNETRTFHLTYTLSGAVKRFPDIGELYFKFVGDGWDRPLGRVRATVHLPGTVPAAEIRAWAHGPLQGLVLPPQDSTVVMSVRPLPARTFFEGRVLFPATVLAAAHVSGATPRLDMILAEEKQWAA
ncbi:MAG: DUF2207 domain-containing protein [Acidobacteriota bacterium]